MLRVHCEKSKEGQFRLIHDGWEHGSLKNASVFHLVVTVDRDLDYKELLVWTRDRDTKKVFSILVRVSKVTSRKF